MNAPIMISVAPLGARAMKKDNPAVPLSPEEIAEDVIACAQAGASIAHIHARDKDGQPTQSLAVFREIVERIREKSDIVLQISLGTKGFTVDQALEPIELKPEMVSLPLAAFVDGTEHEREEIFRMAARIRECGVRPELSIYNQPMIDGARALLDRGAVAPPASFGIFFKDPETMREGAVQLMALADALPQGCVWWMGKGGRFGLGLRALAIELGGHVRVGLEDSTLDFDHAGLAKSNVYLVERVASLCSSLGRAVATPAQARAAVAAA